LFLILEIFEKLCSAPGKRWSSLKVDAGRFSCDHQ